MPEQSTVWIDAFKIGSDVHHEDGSVTEVTTEFVTRLIENFEYCRSKDYAVVLLNNHARTDSNIYGDILGVRAYQGYVQCAVTFTRDQEAEAFESGIMREFSPGFDPDWLDPHTGERRGPTLLELSFTGLAYQRNLRQPLEIQQLSSSTMSLYALSSANIATGGIMGRKKMSEEIEEVELSETEEETVEMSEGEAPTLASLDAKLDALMEMLQGVKQMASEMPEETEEESEEKEETEEEVKNLHRRIRTLEDENTRIQLSQKGIRGDDANLLINLRRHDENLYNATLKRLSKASQEVGVVGVTAVGTTNDVTSVARAAKKAGRVNGGDLVVYLSKNHPDFVERASEVRKALKTL